MTTVALAPPAGRPRWFDGSSLRLWGVLLLSTIAVRATTTLASAAGFGNPEAIDQLRYPLWSLIVAPGMVYAWGAHYLLRPTRFVSGSIHARRLLGATMALIPLTLVHAAYGLVAGNPLRYVAGDTYKYLLVPFGFYLAAVGLRGLLASRRFLSVLAVFGFFPGLDIGGHMLTLGYVYGRKAVYWKRYSWILVIPVVYFAISQNRTSLLMVPPLTVLLYHFARRFSIVRLSTVVLLAIALGYGVYRTVPTLIIDTGAYWKTMYMIDNFQLVDYRMLDESTYHRIQEAVVIAQKFEDAPWVERVVGFGSGAVFRVADLPPAVQSYWDDNFGGYAHHIHLSPVFVYHQWGVPGIVLLAYTLLSFATLGLSLSRRRSEATDPARRERYSLQVAAFLMLVGFLGFGSWNPPKISLFYYGLVTGTLWVLLGSRVVAFRNRGDRGVIADPSPSVPVPSGLRA